MGMALATSSPDDDLFWAAEPSAPSSALPVIGESAVPWLFSSVVIAVLMLVTALRGAGIDVAEQQLVLAVGLAGTMASAGLVLARSRRALQEVVAEERSRPAADQLSVPLQREQVPYAIGMERWTGSMLELVEHALSTLAEEAPERTVLVAAAEDTRDLHELLSVEASGHLPINDQAKLHALGSLWETGQPRIEALAGAADPSWYRRWRARAVVDRRLRHGQDDDTSPIDLPYRA